MAKILHSGAPCELGSRRVKGMIHGYARTSTKGQRDDMQLQALEAAGVEKIWSEVASGAATTRPVLEKMLAAVDVDDQIVVYRLDRLGRSLPHLVATINDLDARGVRVRSLQDPIDTKSATGRMQLGIFALLAQFERELTIERTFAGLAAARASGKTLGRPRKITDHRIQIANQLRKDGAGVATIARELSVSRATVYRMLD